MACAISLGDPVDPVLVGYFPTAAELQSRVGFLAPIPSAITGVAMVVVARRKEHP